MRQLAIALLILLYSCSSPEKRKDSDSVIKMEEINYASHFELGRTDDSTFLIIKSPDGHSTERFSFSNKTKNKVICLSATSIGMFSVLKSQHAIAGISNKDYLFDSTLIANVKKGKVNSFGDESILSTERIIESGANVLLYSGFGNEFPNKEKLERFGILLIPIYDWRESDPLGKAEWIKVIAALCDKDKEASEYIASIAKEYKMLKKQTEHVTNKPKIISGNVIGDFWWAPAGESYSAQLIRDAGGVYSFSASKGTGSLSKTMEEILSTDDSEIWLNPGFETKKLLMETNPVASKMNSFKQIYCYSANMNKYWERAAIEPQKVLEDLIRIFHPDLLEPGGFHFYKKVEN